MQARALSPLSRALSVALISVFFGTSSILSCGIKVSSGTPDGSPTPPPASPSPELEASPTPPPDPIYEGVFSAEPDALRFGDVVISTTVRKDVYFRNNSPERVYLNGFVVNSTFPCFAGQYVKVCDWDMEGDTPPPLPEYLLEGETVGFCVNFNPAQPGNFKGSLTLLSDSGNPSIPLTGTGVAASSSFE